ncbi:MAG: hypothetical protein ABSC06_36075 [Rhodopila sp.]|jgi:hypothetical protein
MTLKHYLYFVGGIIFVVVGAKFVILAGLAWMIVLAALAAPGATVSLLKAGLARFAAHCDEMGRLQRARIARGTKGY